MQSAIENKPVKFIDVFPSGNLVKREKLNQALGGLENIPDSFCGTTWLHDHDFLYMSPRIERVLGHAHKNFLKNGLLYFQSITPRHWVEHIFSYLAKHISALEKSPATISGNSISMVDAALLNSLGEEVPIRHTAMMIDRKLLDHKMTYLVLGSWMDKRHKTDDEINRVTSHTEEILIRAKAIYMQLYPERFNSEIFSPRLTLREKQVALMLADGLTTKRISEKLSISFNTVETYRKNLLEKFEAKNSAELIMKAGKFLSAWQNL